MTLHIIILAAGLGKRMVSQKPKVLHELGGKSLLARVIDTAQTLQPAAIHVIYGHEGDQILQALTDKPVHWINQTQQLGTGHAVMQAMPEIPQDAQVLILYGDVPLIESTTLVQLIQSATEHQALALLLATLDNPFGMGRILRNNAGMIEAIVEEKDATPAQRKIKETYTGICCASSNDLTRWLPKLTQNNIQHEYYLTDIIAMAVNEQQNIQSIEAPHEYEIKGVNDRLQLHTLERLWQQQQAERLMLSGVTIADSTRFDIRGELHCGKDIFIDANCVFIGKVHIEDGCIIGPNCILTDTHIGANSQILAHSVLDGCQIGVDCHIGPFARLRPGTKLGPQCKIGNFVETKKAIFGSNSKASHLSYLGDVTIGNDVNIGAGTITCNYDGINKHQTIIEDGAFIGSDTQLIAPVKVGAHATIGAGCTLRQNAPGGELTLTESKQKTIYGWKRPKKK